MLASAIRFMLYVKSYASNRSRGTVATVSRRILHHNVKYPHLCLETVFPALKLIENRHLHYNVNIFLENC